LIVTPSALMMREKAAQIIQNIQTRFIKKSVNV